MDKPSARCRKPDVNDEFDRKVDISAQNYPAGIRYQALMSQRFDKTAPTVKGTFCLKELRKTYKERNALAHVNTQTHSKIVPIKIKHNCCPC